MDSIAGYFITQYGNIPQPDDNANVEYENYLLKADKIEGSRLVSLYVERLNTVVDEENELQED